MVDIQKCNEVAIFSFEWKGESFLVFTSCGLEIGFRTNCSFCGKNTTLEARQTFISLGRIVVQEYSTIDTQDILFRDYAERELKKKLAKNLCLACREKETRKEILANLPIDPLWI